jgi:hypothetical protein
LHEARVGSFIIGATYEIHEEILNTINSAQRVPIDIPQFNILGAHPDNDIWNEFVAKSFLDPEKWWEKGVAVYEVYPYAKVSRDEIIQIVHNAFFQHVYRPAFLAKQAAQTLRSKYRMKVLVSNLSRLGEIREATNSVA